jgi:translocator protein
MHIFLIKSFFNAVDLFQIYYILYLYMKLIASILFCQFAGIIGSIFTFPSITTWYQQLNKPFFNPPNWVFGPVWTLLYTLMGISLYYIYGKGITKKNKQTLIIFLVQLILNSFWSIAFFGLHSPLFGLFVILPMWFFILMTIIKSYPISKRASYLLIPYLCWVSFASLLNFAVYLLNP